MFINNLKIELKNSWFGFCFVFLFISAISAQAMNTFSTKTVLIGQNDSQLEKSLGKKTVVVLKTTKGRIDILLWPDIAPLACENFERLVEKGYYDGVLFHRVVKDFMIQTGDPTGTGKGGKSIWGKPFKNEINSHVKFHKAGLVAMANSGPDTNGSQFFITTRPSPWLNGKYTIFGVVLRGMGAVEKIENVSVDNKDRPLKKEKIIKAYVTKRYARNKNYAKDGEL